MKRTIALLLTLLMCLPIIVGCGDATTAKEEPTSKPLPTEESAETAETKESEVQTLTPVESQSTETPTESPDAPEEALRYGMYYFTSANGHRFSTSKTGTFIADNADEKYTRFTVHYKPITVNGETELYYGIYRDSDELTAIGYAAKGDVAKLFNTSQRYVLSDDALWQFEDAGEGYFRIINKATITRKNPLCITLKNGKATLEEIDVDDNDQRFKIEKAAPSDEYDEFMSDKGNIVLRVPKTFITRKSIGATAELLQDYTNWFQEAYEAEIELTGYIPYDVIVINAWQPQDIVAGVVDNYNQITVNNGFMEGEVSKLVKRKKLLGIMDVGFAMLHEMGHMFDSQRGWNFESEAWTDLKLCYVIYKMTEDHKDTDGLIFGCSSSDYDYKYCHTYEQMAEGLDIHKNKGAMETVYGFFGAARLFLLMAYDFGWEPFIKTFHWFQENNIVQQSIPDRWDKFTTFVEKLSEFSGKDIQHDYLSEANWEVFRRYYQGETTDVV